MGKFIQAGRVDCHSCSNTACLRVEHNCESLRWCVPQPSPSLLPAIHHHHLRCVETPSIPHSLTPSLPPSNTPSLTHSTTHQCTGMLRASAISRPHSAPRMRSTTLPGTHAAAEAVEAMLVLLLLQDALLRLLLLRMLCVAGGAGDRQERQRWGWSESVRCVACALSYALGCWCSHSYMLMAQFSNNCAAASSCGAGTQHTAADRHNHTTHQNSSRLTWCERKRPWPGEVLLLSCS